jgi:hypothetical protein
MTERACSILLAHDDLVLRLSLRQLGESRDDLPDDVVVVDVLSVPALSDPEAAAVLEMLNDPVILEEIIHALSGANDRVPHARRPSKLL